MKKVIMLIFSIFFYKEVIAQQRKYQKEIQITKVEFDKHQPLFDFIIRPSKGVKSKGIIKIKTPKRIIVLKDDGEMVQYLYEGDLKGTPLILIHELEPNTEEYYFINRQSGAIDTLLGKPIFYSNKRDIACLEGSGTDTKQRIQIGQIMQGRFKTKYLFTLKDGINPDYVYWFNTHTIFIKTQQDYWRLNFNPQ